MEKEGRELGSLRRAVTAIGVLVVIMDLSGGMEDRVSVVREGRTWCGSFVEDRRSRREKKHERREMGAKRTGSMRPRPPLETGRQHWAHERGVRVMCRHFCRDDAKRLAQRTGKSERRGGGGHGGEE